MSEYLTTAQAAARLGVDPAHVRRLCLAGKLIGAERWGRDWRIPARAVEQYQQQSRKPGRKPQS